MTEHPAEVNPRGIFDRSKNGHTTNPVSVQIERGRIRFLAQVLGLADPIHFDVETARTRGYPDLVAPPSFFMVIEADASEHLRRLGHRSILDQIGSDYRYLLHGDERYDYSGALFAGDEVSLTTRIVDFYDRKGGSMEFVTLRSTVSHSQRGVLIDATRTLLHRLP